MKELIFILALLWPLCKVPAKTKLEQSKESKIKALADHKNAFISMSDKIRDPFIMKGPDGQYYMTGTTAGSFWGETVGVKIWKSNDLCEWEDLGYVWTLDGDGKDSWYFNRPPAKSNKPAKHPYAVWAPEIHYLNGTWWLTVSRNGGGNGLLKSTTGNVFGPYEEVLHYDKGIDSHLFSDGDDVYYTYGYQQLAKMTPDMSGIQDTKFTALQLPGKHDLGYEGILIIKIEDQYVYIASGRYGYEPTSTYDLYYSVSQNIYDGYSPRRMAIKNAGHGNLIQDPEGKWWATAFDHEFTDDWCCWLVPIDIKVVDDDVIFEVLDERFRPTEEDQKVVRELSVTGPPEEWKGKAWWWRPEGGN